MAYRVLAFCGWQGNGGYNRTGSWHRWHHFNQGIFDIQNGGADIQPPSTRNGRVCSPQWPVAGFGKTFRWAGGTSTAALTARVKNFIGWNIGWRFMGSVGGGTPQVADKYFVARFSTDQSGAGSPKQPFFGMLMQIVAVGPPIQVNMRPCWFNAAGVFQSTIGSTTATYTDDTGWKMTMLEVDIPLKKFRTVDHGTAGAWFAWPATNMWVEGHFLPDNSFQAGKGGDIGPEMYYQDWFSTDEDAAGECVHQNMYTMLAQPSCDVTGYSDWTGTPENTFGRRYSNWDHEADDGPNSGKNYPALATDQQACALKDEPGAPGATIEAVRLRWMQGYGAGPAVNPSVSYARTGAGAFVQEITPAQEGTVAPYDWHWWRESHWQQTPEGAAWTVAAFNNLQAMLKGGHADGVEEIYAEAIGVSLNQTPANTVSPAPTCPAAGFSQLLEGALTFSGLLINKPLKYLTGILTSVGTLIKMPIRPLAGVLIFGGTLTSSLRKLLTLTGTLGLAGILIRIPVKALTGTLTFVGILRNLPVKLLSGILVLGGLLLKKPLKALLGALLSTGILVHLAIIPLAGSLVLIGALVNFPKKFLVGALTFTGALVKVSPKLLAGTLTFVGDISRGSLRTLIGTLIFTGIVVPKCYKLLSGALTFIGTTLPEKLVGLIYKSLTGTLSFTGTLSSIFLQYIAVVITLLSGRLTNALKTASLTLVTLSGKANITSMAATFLIRLLSGKASVAKRDTAITITLISGKADILRESSSDE